MAAAAAATLGSEEDRSSRDRPDGLADPALLPGDRPLLASTDLDLECDPPPAVLSASDSGDDAYDSRDAIGNRKSSASDSSG
jgi:hypothetical protein